MGSSELLPGATRKNPNSADMQAWLHKKPCCLQPDARLGVGPPLVIGNQIGSIFGRLRGLEMLNETNSLDLFDGSRLLLRSVDGGLSNNGSQPSFDLDVISKAAIQTIFRVQQQVHEDIATDPVNAFEPLAIGTRGKRLLAIDLVAERNAARELHRMLPSYPLLVLGEESLRDPNLDLTEEPRLVALVDMIDGTDLLERGLSNWCSALVFYYPPQKQILAAFVGLPHDAIYFATNDSSHPKKYAFHGGPAILPVAGPSAVKTIEEGSLAFYGQKYPNLSSVTDSGFLAYSAHLQHVYAETGRELKTRIYNLAGNPIAMRLIDGTSRFDAIFDLRGQAPHDIVPGAFIAERAGASLCDLDGQSIDLNQILLRPANPNSRIRYILASTQELSLQLRQCLMSDHWECEHPRSIAA